MPKEQEQAGPRLAIFSNDRTFWNGMAVVAGVIAIGKGVQRPLDWALTQASVDYRFGFVKRGLPGAMYHHLHIERASGLTAAFDVELALFFILIGVILVRSRLADRFGDARLIAAFAGSYAFTICADIIGYADIINGCLAMSLLLIAKPRVRFVLALPLIAIGMLVHENFLLMWLPVVLLSFLADAWAEDSSAKRTQFLGMVALLAIGSLACDLMIARHSLRSSEAVAQISSDMAARVDFHVRQDFVETLHTTLRSNVSQMKSITLHRPFVRTQELLGLFLLGPIAWLLVSQLRRILNVNDSTHHRTLRWLIYACVAAPLGLHVLGWDVIRWDAMFVVSLMLTIAVFSRALPMRAMELSPAQRNLVLLVLLLGIAGGGGMFYGRPESLYPFWTHWVPTSWNQW